MSVKLRWEKPYLLMLPFMMESFSLVPISIVCPNAERIISLGMILSLISFEKQPKWDIHGCMALVLVRICWSLLWTEWSPVIQTIDTLSKLNVWWCTKHLAIWWQNTNHCHHHQLLLLMTFYVRMNITVPCYPRIQCYLVPLPCVTTMPSFLDHIVTFWYVEECHLSLLSNATSSYLYQQASLIVVIITLVSLVITSTRGYNHILNLTSNTVYSIKSGPT